MKLAPVALFVYNRTDHVQRTLKSLMVNELADRSDLYIFSDGPRENASEKQIQKIKEVRNLIREKKWCGKVEIIERKENLGLAVSIISGVTEVVNTYGKIIVLEDDLILSPGFLNYMNDGLSLYESDNRVFHIAGHIFETNHELPDTFFYNETSCWGWGTCRN